MNEKYKSFDNMMKTLYKIMEAKRSVIEPTKNPSIKKYINQIEDNLAEFAAGAANCGFEDHLIMWLYFLRIIRLGPKEFEKRIINPIIASIELEMIELMEEIK